MLIGPIASGIHSPSPIRALQTAPPVRAAFESFASVLADAVQRLQASPVTVGQATEALAAAASLTSDPAQVLYALSAAGSSLPMFAQVGSRAVAAYQEIVGMQV